MATLPAKERSAVILKIASRWNCAFAQRDQLEELQTCEGMTMSFSIEF